MIPFPVRFFDDARLRWPLFAALLCALAALSLRSLTGLMLDAHDHENFLDSAAISEDFAYLFTTDKHHTSGRPLYEFIIWVGYVLWGDDARYFHLLGIAWHVAAALLLTRLCQRLGAEWTTSAATGLLFFYAASHYRAIHWISAQCYVVSFILLCCGLLAHIARDDGKPWAGAALYIALFCGLLVHTATIVVLPLAAARSWSQRRQVAAVLKRLAWPFAVGVLGVVAIRTYYANAPQVGQLSGGFDPFGHVASLLYMISRLFTTAYTLPFALGETARWEPVVGGVVLLGCGALALRRCGTASFWAVWTVACLLPFLALAPEHIAALMPGPSRYLYAASAGVAALGGLLLGQLAGRVGRSAFLLLIPLALLGHFNLQHAEGISHYLSGRAAMVSREWETGTAQLEQAMECCAAWLLLEDTYHRIFVAQLALGEEVDARLVDARERLPASPVLAILGEVLAAEDADPQVRGAALQNIEQHILDAGESRGDLHNIADTFFRNRGVGLVKKGKYARALPALRQVLKRHPQDQDIVIYWAYAHFHLGNYAEAARAWTFVDKPEWVIQTWKKAVAAAPDDAHVRLELARSLTLDDKRAEAIQQYQMLLETNASAEVYFELALMYLHRGDRVAGRRQFALGVELFGLATAERLGVEGQLRELTERQPASAAAELLERYWPP
ncbi:MAG: tetratricopeptide repeat protein [Candidatus Latescibacteria bacterium]|nr:tetratricopeptide repeat protein [Candidatus Latescibacterota bacterium]